VAAAVSKGDLSRLEHGMKPPPSIVVLLRLSEALGPGVAEWRSTCS
jgi:transcriptional regulator with XRE-family HTH domain